MHPSSPDPTEQRVLQRPPLAALAPREFSHPAASAEGAYSSRVRNRDISNRPFSPRQPETVYAAEHLINRNTAGYYLQARCNSHAPAPPAGAPARAQTIRPAWNQNFTAKSVERFGHFDS